MRLLCDLSNSRSRQIYRFFSFSDVCNNLQNRVPINISLFSNMSHKSKEVIKKDVVQAVVIADNFKNNFSPITSDSPLALLPLLNVPLIDYTLEFLSLGGIEETFLFCCSYVNLIKEHIEKSIKKSVGWSLTMKVNIIVSESCRSFGDCLRDLDAKGMIRNNFVLLEPGTLGNIKLLPIIKKHNETSKADKGIAMTLIMQEAGVGQAGRCLHEDLLLVSTLNHRVLFHQKLGRTASKKIKLPLEILVDNPAVNILHNLKDTHIAICSSSVLPLFSDNFDFQTRDDFIRGLLINEEILGSTMYWHQVKGSQYGASITNWRMYQAVSREILHRWTYPLVPDMGISTRERNYTHLKNNIYRNKNVQLAKNSNLIEDVMIGSGSSVLDNTQITCSIIGENVKIGRNVTIQDSFIFSNTIIGDNCTVSHSIIGYNCNLRHGNKVTFGSILGSRVELPKDKFIENSLIQSVKPTVFSAGDKLGDKAYKLKQIDNDEDIDPDENTLVKQLSRLHIADQELEDSDDESVEFSKSDEELSYTQSPIPDDTNMFLTEVIDSLARGFEDKLQCDNLILEINSSRYAYNVTVKEVNFNVVKAILMLPFQLSIGQAYLHSLRPLLVYFLPILKNYIRNTNAMTDCLQAIEDVASTNNELNECVVTVLNWFYDKDYLSEEMILSWFSSLDKNTRFYARVQPFIVWLQEAEEASSEDD